MSSLSPNIPVTGFPGTSISGYTQFFKTLPLPLPQTATKVIFNIVNGGGLGPLYSPVVVVKLFGIVTTAIGAVANATKLQALMDALAAVDLCATTDLNAATVGTILSVSGTAADALGTNVNGVQTGQTNDRQMMLSGGSGPSTGVIQINCAGSDGGVGRVIWCLVCRLAYGVRIRPADA